MSESTRPKRTIGHDALRLAIENERACFSAMLGKTYVSGSGYEFLIDRDPDAYQTMKVRWEAAVEFSNWMMAEFKRQYGPSES